jgi:hypothetical protein
VAFDTASWAQFALDLVNAFGSSFTLKAVGPGAFNPATLERTGPPKSEEYAVTGVIVGNRKFFDPGTQVAREGPAFVCAALGLPAGIEPQENWEVWNSDATRMWRITGVPIAARPDGVTPICFACAVIG